MKRDLTQQMFCINNNILYYLFQKKTGSKNNEGLTSVRFSIRLFNFLFIRATDPFLARKELCAASVKVFIHSFLRL